MHSGTFTATTDIQVVSGYAEGNMANSPDDNRLLSAPRTATDVTYSCMKVRIPEPTAAPDAELLRPLQELQHRTSRRACTWRPRTPPSPSRFRRAPSTTPTQWPVALNYGQWYIVATKYDAATGLATMWVDPVDESSASVTDVGTYPSLVVVAYALRQSTANWKFDVDDLGVGDCLHRRVRDSGSGRELHLGTHQEHLQLERLVRFLSAATLS